MSEQKVNPLLSKIKLPGRIFKLPSGGYLYKNGELSNECQNGEVHVRAMSAISEIKMKSPDMLFSGKAIEETIMECIPEIKKPFDLFGRDIDAILCFLRVVTYGPKFTIETRHTCDNAKPHTYDIDVDKIISELVYLDPTIVDATYSVTLENGQVVKLEPMRFKHIIEMVQLNNKQADTSLDIQKSLIKNVLNMVSAVDDITDKKMIEEWLRQVPTSFISRITDAMQQANKWGPELEADCRCLDCMDQFRVEVPVNPLTFFSE
jgi:hypothetical protein